LASGSDDQHLNIHSYQPESSVSQFVLSTTVTTGHAANIFSVKFMPASNDNTLVTCAGDGQVRVFDLEYSGQSSSSIAQTTPARQNLSRDLSKGVRYLSSATTNARVYRSHADRVKRIVTESSPYLFLTCSEDGEVGVQDARACKQN
jgi:nuclear receptor interaction protein